MAYELIFSATAERDVERVPPALLTYLEGQLDRLMATPVALSRPSVSPPWPPRCQLFEFMTPTSRGLYRFAVLFRY